MTARWAKVPGAGSYQLQWRERGGAWKARTVKSTKTTVKGLKPSKTAFVQVRALRQLGDTTYAGALTRSAKSIVKVAGNSTKAKAQSASAQSTRGALAAASI